MYENIAECNTINYVHQEKIKYFIVLIGTIFLLTINMCDRGRTITHLQISWFHTQVYNNGRDGISNHQPHECLLSRLIRRRSEKTSKLHVTGFCAGNSLMTGEFPAQIASNAEYVSNWWRHHGLVRIPLYARSPRPVLDAQPWADHQCSFVAEDSLHHG